MRDSSPGTHIGLPAPGQSEPAQPCSNDQYDGEPDDLGQCQMRLGEDAPQVSSQELPERDIGVCPWIPLEAEKGEEEGVGRSPHGIQEEMAGTGKRKDEKIRKESPHNGADKG